MKLGEGRPFPGPAPLVYRSPINTGPGPGGPLRNCSSVAPVLDDLVHSSLRQFSYEDLKMFTDDFCDANFIVRTQFCKVYRGKISNASHNGKEEEEQFVTVKVFADSVDWPGYGEVCRVDFAGNFERCKDEVKFLTSEELNTHPNTVKLMGLCCEIENENLAVVYNLNSYDVLRNLIPEEFLKWEDRINIALKLACFLEALHNHQPRLLVLNISAAHIMIDQDLNPVLLDFGLLTTEFRTELFRFPHGAYGYPDPLSISYSRGEWTDVFGLGVVLMEMLSRRTIDDGVKEFKVRKPHIFNHYAAVPMYEKLIKEKWKVSKWLLVAESFDEDAEFNHHDGDLLTILALECITYEHPPRPTITAVINRLKRLYVLGGSKSDQLMHVEDASMPFKDASMPVKDASMPVRDASIIKTWQKMMSRPFRKKNKEDNPLTVNFRVH